MTKPSLAFPCWIYLDGTYHNISNLFVVKEEAHENGEQYPSESRRTKSAKIGESKRSSPYTSVRVLMKSVLSDEASHACQATVSQTTKTLQTRNDYNLVGPLQVQVQVQAPALAPQDTFCSVSVLTDDCCSTFSHRYLAYDVEGDEDRWSYSAEEPSLYSNNGACTSACTGLAAEAWKNPLIDESAAKDCVFRGAVETWEAFQRGRFTLTTCMDCGDHMISVEDAAYVVCSHCRLVYPLAMRGNKSQVGIGMGFKPKWCLALLAQTTRADVASDNMSCW
jgi:hypothetical protein